jgi:hypothetical protein
VCVCPIQRLASPDLSGPVFPLSHLLTGQPDGSPPKLERADVEMPVRGMWVWDDSPLITQGVQEFATTVRFISVKTCRGNQMTFWVLVLNDTTSRAAFAVLVPDFFSSCSFLFFLSATCFHLYVRENQARQPDYSSIPSSLRGHTHTKMVGPRHAPRKGVTELSGPELIH